MDKNGLEKQYYCFYCDEYGCKYKSDKCNDNKHEKILPYNSDPLC